ncbi:unnamed protein product [Diamesa hyperborea]
MLPQQPQQYCLRWKYHHSNLQTMFSQLLDRGCFCDVTLACDGQTLKAHRVVLSACSTYFDSILTNCNSEKDPIIILKDVKFMDIKYLVEFMYKGEINVEHNNLASLLKTAEELRIKGLAEVSWRDDDTDNPENNDNNNNTVTDSIPYNHHITTTTPVQPIHNHSHQSNTNGIKEYDNKENLLKTLPFLAPLSSPKDLSSTSRKKRGRPPLDESNHLTRAPKYTHLSNEHLFYESENDNKNNIYDLSTASTSSTTNTTTTTQIALNRLMHDEQTPKSHHDMHHNERADTPTLELTEEDDENILCSPAEHLQSIFLTNEEREEWKDVIRMNDYLTKGRRPQFWEEPFTKRVLDAIKNKNLEMKKAAKLLGVSYGTLYGRYRETYGCLKHPYRGPPGSYMVSRMREMWPGNSDEQTDLLNLVQRQRMISDEGQNLMEMISDEAMLEQLASNHAKSYTRKMLNSLDVSSLLKQVHNTKTSPSSNNSASSRSESPNALPASSSGSLMVTAVAPSGSTSIEVAK